MKSAGRLWGLVLIIAAISMIDAEAALIYGTIYDFNFEPTGSAVVEVNSSPIQRYLTKEGKYSFVLDQGSYTIKTRQKIGEITYYAEENVSVSDDGVYVIDLFLFPDIKEDDVLYEQFGEVKDVQGSPWKFPITLISVLVIIVIASVFSYKRYISRFKKTVREPEKLERGFDYTGRIIKILKGNGGRLTQKDIRNKIPYSEAKISLLISELESEGRVKRIKKGRGNIIVLVK